MSESDNQMGYEKGRTIRVEREGRDGVFKKEAEAINNNK